MNIKQIQISENEIYDIGVEIQNVEGLQDYEFITNADIDNIWGGVPEDILPESDIDELMNRLG